MDQYRVNDSHVHLGKSDGIYSYFEALDIIAYREKNNIDKVLVMSLDLDIHKNNTTISYMADTYEWIYGLYWINGTDWYYPLTPKMIGCKFHGTYEGRTVSDNFYHPIMQYLNDNNAVLVIHCGRYKEGHFRSNTSYVHALAVAQKYPGIKVIMAHMGGSDTTICKKAIQNSKDCNNVYFDTSGITTPYIIEYALTYLQPERILFGSDAPWCSFRSMYYNVIDAKINEIDKEKILYTNFNSLLEPIKINT